MGQERLGPEDHRCSECGETVGVEDERIVVRVNDDDDIYYHDECVGGNDE